MPFLSFLINLMHPKLFSRIKTTAADSLQNVCYRMNMKHFYINSSIGSYHNIA